MVRNRTMKRDSFAQKRVTALPADAPGVELSWRGWPRAEASTLQVVYIAFKMPVYPGQIYRREMVEGKRERERERASWFLATCLGHSFTAFALYIARKCSPDKTICNNPLKLDDSRLSLNTRLTITATRLGKKAELTRMN